MKVTGNGYTTTSSKRFGYIIVKVACKAEPNKYYIYKPATVSDSEQFVKEKSSYKDAVNWCKLNRKN